mmetsp:Transcript_884/g.3238  ORF Transcript_884/g.3238 Transcript_884/m.3238 type:complete len:227 (-) Transcript_884:93-773(-)
MRSWVIIAACICALACTVAGNDAVGDGGEGSGVAAGRRGRSGGAPRRRAARRQQRADSALAGGGRDGDAAEWAPQCKGKSPASPPKIKGGWTPPRGGRRLQSEAPTKLVVEKNPPDDKLRNEVYDYLRDYMASEVPCTPRSLQGKNIKCSGMGGGLSCRGAKDPVCKEAPLVGPDGRGPIHPSPDIYRGPKIFAPKEWGRCAFIATGENVLKDTWGDEINAHDVRT